MIVPESLVRQELCDGLAGVHWAGQAGSAGDAGEEEEEATQTSTIFGYKAFLPVPKVTSCAIREILLPHLGEHKIPAFP